MRARSRLAVARRVWPWLPLAFAAAYLVLLVADLRSVVQSLHQQADFASGPYIGELYPEAPPDAEVVLTRFAWYTTLWFEQLTHGLPAHRQIWQLGPWAASLLGVGVLAWATARAAGAWAATMVAVVLACAGPGLLLVHVPGTGHAPTFFHVCLLGAYLVLLAGGRGARLGRPAVQAAGAAVVTALTAAGLASDTLLLVAGIAPFALAGLYLGRRLAPPAGRRVAVTAGLVAAGATAGGFVIRAIMEARGVAGADLDVRLAAFDGIAPNLRLLLHSVAYLFNGDFGGMPVDAKGLLALACAAVLAAAVAVAVRLGLARSREAVSEPRAALAPGTRDAARAAHTTFWLLSALVAVAAFVLTDLPVDRYSGRYVVSAGYALAALAAVVAAGRGTAARAAVVVGVCIVVAGSVRALAAREVQSGLADYPSGAQSGPLLRLARSEGLDFGYAGYWTAAPLGWQMKTEVQLYPVEPCAGDAGRLCPSRIHRIDSWYRPRPGTRSMLVIDPAFTDRAPVEAPRSLGPPERTVAVDRLTVHVYSYDIASRLGDP